MMKCIVSMYNTSIKAISETEKSENKVTWGVINTTCKNLIIELSRMKFQDPVHGEQTLRKYFNELNENIKDSVSKLAQG